MTLFVKWPRMRVWHYARRGGQLTVCGLPITKGVQRTRDFGAAVVRAALAHKPERTCKLCERGESMR